MDGVDLRKHQDSEEMQNAFSKLVSGGKQGYRTVIDKNKQPKYCKQCNYQVQEEDKFCPNCGAKIEN